MRVWAVLGAVLVTGCVGTPGVVRAPAAPAGRSVIGEAPEPAFVVATSAEVPAITRTSEQVRSLGPRDGASTVGKVTEPSPCPPDMALVFETVCVDRWEGSLVALVDGGERPWSPHQAVDAAHMQLRAVSRPGVVPQSHISGNQAGQACRAAGKRLCREDEWEAACRGPGATTYPYGDQRLRSMCNDDGRRRHPVVEVTQRLGLPADRMWYEGMDHPLINQLEDTLRKTGESRGCTNDLGVFDMVGNLHEWVEDPDGTFRGGFYLDTKINGEGCFYATTAHGKDYHDYSTGFRCCRDADPP